MKAKCHNMEKKDAVFSKEHLCGGKIIESFIPTCEEDGFTILQRKRGIRFDFCGIGAKAGLVSCALSLDFCHR